MPLVMKWQQGEVTLYQAGQSGEPLAEIPLSRIELSFELKPTSLLLSEDRHRLQAVLQQLRATSGSEEILVDLILPSSWGVTHTIPNPNLQDADLREHLRWEISKALIDSEDQYRYNFSFSEDGSVHIAALRLQLLDPINRLISETGYQLQGLFLDSVPLNRVNLIAQTPEAPIITIPKPAEEDRPSRRHLPEEYVKLPRMTVSPSSRFFTLVLILGILFIAYFAYVKLMKPKPAAYVPTRKTVAKLEERMAERLDTVRTDTAKVAVVSSPADTTKTVSDTIKPAPIPAATALPAGRWVDMQRRLELARSVLDIFPNGKHLDLMSFTADRFLCQVNSADTVALDQTLSQIGKLSNLSEIKTSHLRSTEGDYRGVISGRMLVQAGQHELKNISKDAVIALGKKFGLQNKELVFTGSQSNILDFMSAIADEQCGVYRMIIVPWGEAEYRVVLEL